MEFALDETPQAVRDLAADVLRREGARHQSSGHDMSAAGYCESTWKAMAEAGLLSLAVPEHLDGEGMGALETAIVLSEVGRKAIAVPALATLSLGVLPIARHGTGGQQERLLRGVPSGEVLTAALDEPSSSMPRSPRTIARRDHKDVLVSGTKTNVLYADTASTMLVSVSLDDASSGNSAVAIVPAGANGMSLSPASMSSGAIGWTLQFDSVRGEILGRQDDTDPAGILDDLYRCALAGICALGDGVVAGALDLTAEHVRTRTQFGRRLAEFQAVAGQLADVYVTARTSYLATLSACWRLAEGYDAEQDLAVAALWLAEEAPKAMHVCQHLHGGIGVDMTYPMHRHYSLIKDLARLAGGAGHRVDVLADVLASG